jgi:hypothetical protein
MWMWPFEIVDIRKTTVNVVKSGLILARDQDRVIHAEMSAGALITSDYMLVEGRLTAHESDGVLRFSTTW